MTTARWFQLPMQVLTHPVQTALKNDFLSGDSRFHVVAAGRRSFKTERMKRWFVGDAMTRADERYFLGAPTRTQAKLIFWLDCLDLSHPDSISDINKSDLIIRYKSGTELHVVGLDAYKRIEGVRWNRAGVSEYQEVDADFFSRTLEPILNDTRGRCILEGRPVGRNHFYDHFRRGDNPEYAEWRSYTWPSSDILSAQQIADARRDLAREDYEREYEASFEAGSSRAYYSFGAENYSSRRIEMSSPVIIACDFNAGARPMSWSIGQHIDGYIYWWRTLAFTHTNTRAMCMRLEEQLLADGGMPPVLIFYGDYAGNQNKSNSDATDWEIIERHFTNKTQFTRRVQPCLSVRGRVAATNGLLCNMDGERRMFVHPTQCAALVEDWDRVQWKANSVELDGTDEARTHASDAVDYFSMVEYPIQKKARRVV